MRLHAFLPWAVAGCARVALAGDVVTTPRLIVATDQMLPVGEEQLPLQSLGAINTGAWAQISNDGTVAFAGRVQDETGQSRPGYWIARGGSFQAVAVANEEVPGLPGYRYRPSGFVFEPQVAGERLMATSIELVGPRPTDYAVGLFGGSGVPLPTLGVTGQQIPGQPSGVVYYSFALPRPTSSGYVNAVATFEGPGITSANDTAMFQFTGSTPRQIAREGDQAPGESTGVTYSRLAALASTNATGLSALTGEVAGPGITPGVNSIAAWRETDSGMERVFRQGVTPAPGLAGAEFSSFAPRFSAGGTFGVMASLIEGPGITPANDSGIWLWDGTYHQLAREGSSLNPADPGARRLGQAPVGGATAVSDLGLVSLFATTVDQSGIERGSFLVGDSSGLHVAWDLGAQAPGLPGGVVLASALPPALNELGQGAFTLGLAGTGVNTSNDRALYLMDDEVLHLVAREGDLLEYVPGSFARILELSGSSLFAQLNDHSLNDRGDFLFAASLDNGMSGLFVTTIPAPPTLMVFLLIVVGTKRNRPRAR